MYGNVSYYWLEANIYLKSLRQLTQTNILVNSSSWARTIDMPFIVTCVLSIYKLSSHLPCSSNVIRHSIIASLIAFSRPKHYIPRLKIFSHTPTSLSCNLSTFCYVPTHFLSPIYSIPFKVKYSLFFTNYFSLILSSSCLQSSMKSAIRHCPIPVIYRTQTQ